MNTDALLIVAGMIFVVGMASLIGLFVWSRREDRTAREEAYRLR